MEKSKKSSRKDSSGKAKRKGSSSVAAPHPEVLDDVKSGNFNKEVRFT